MPKNANLFICDICDFKCSKESNFNKHVLTPKHQTRYKMVQNDITPSLEENSRKFACKCGNIYKHYSGLWRHKNTCKNAEIKNINSIEKDEIKTLTTLVLDVVKQNQELISQNNEFQKHNQELQKNVIEVLKNGTVNNTMNNSNNNTFNLQLFLNETCKDAMNIMDFVDSIKIQLADMESIGELGFVNGMSKLIIKNLKALDENMRPVHCSDPKRDTMYVKDSNVWEKENSENMKIKKAIKYIAHKNICALPQWRDKFPDCVYSDSKKSDQYNHIVLEAMGGSGDNDEDKANKIVKKIAKEVVIDKNLD
jgi:hypothetical protein